MRVMVRIKILDANTYQLIDTVKFSDDADQLRYDEARGYSEIIFRTSMSSTKRCIGSVGEGMKSNFW